MAITPPPVLAPPEVLVQVSRNQRSSLQPADGRLFLDTNPRRVGTPQQAPLHLVRVRVLSTPEGVPTRSAPCRPVYGQVGQVNDLSTSIPHAGDGTYRLAVTVAPGTTGAPECDGPTTEVAYRVDTRVRLRFTGRLVQNDEKPVVVPLSVRRVVDGARVEAEVICARDPVRRRGGGLTGSRTIVGYIGTSAELNGFITPGRWACVARQPAFRPGLRGGSWSAPTPVQVVR
jgi:hypothetical protein